MEIQNLEVFPSLIKRVKNFLSSDECTCVKDGIDTSTFEPYGALEGDAVTTFHWSNPPYNKSILDDIEYVLPIKKKLQKFLDQYTHDVGIGKVELSTSWITVQRPGSILKSHTHPLSILSGVMYINVDEKSSAIKFSNPNPYIDTMVVKEFTKFTYEMFWIKPEIGDLLIFPSWMKHGSVDRTSIDVNQSEQRIIISFNTRG